MDSRRVPKISQPVVIADADPGNVRHLERQLRSAGVRNPILDFNDGPALQSFLEKAAEDDAKPCVVFFDPRLPGAHGYDPIRWIKQNRRLHDTKVVVFSSTNHPEEIEGAADLGVHLFLKKHPNTSSLTVIVNHLCGVHQDHGPQTSSPDVDPSAHQRR